MLKEFIEHIQKTTQPQIKDIDGVAFAITHDGMVEEILPTIFHPSTLKLNSLDALVKLVKTEASEMDTPLYITIPFAALASPTRRSSITGRCTTKPRPRMSPAGARRTPSGLRKPRLP